MMHLELTLAPDWDRVSDVRDAVISGARSMGVGAATTENIGLVASELLENAIKYGAFHGSRPIQMVVRVSMQSARIVVTNPVDLSSDHPTRLREAIARVDGAASARDAYLARMTEILDEPAVSHARPTLESGLGILRIVHEGASTLSVRIVDGAHLEVTASLRPVVEDDALVA